MLYRYDKVGNVVALYLAAEGDHVVHPLDLVACEEPQRFERAGVGRRIGQLVPLSVSRIQA